MLTKRTKADGAGGLPLRLELTYEYPGYVETKAAVQPALHGLLEVAASASVSPSEAPCEISLVVDESMSMNACMAVVRETLLFLLDRCPAGTRVSLTGFSQEAVVYASAALSTDRALRDRVRQLDAKSSTNLEAGLLHGLGAFRGGGGRRRCLVLLTDGEANAGVTDPESIYASVRDRMRGIDFCALAIGTRCNMSLLSELTMQAEGRCLCIEGTDRIPKAVGSLFGGLLTPGPRQVRVRFPEGADPRVSGLPLAEGGGGRVVVLGDMSSGERVSIPFLLERRKGGARTLWFEATYQDGKGEGKGEARAAQLASAAPLESAPAGARRNPRVALHLLRVRIAAALQSSREAGRAAEEEEWKRCVQEGRRIAEAGLSEDLSRLRTLLLLRAEEALRRATGELPSLTLPELRRAATTELTRQISQDADDAFATPHMRSLAEQAEQSVGRGGSAGAGALPEGLTAPRLTRS